jgi:integrase
MPRGDGRIYLRGESFWVCYYLRGVQYREPVKDKDGKNTSDPTIAEKFLRNRLKEVHADEVGARTFVTPQSRRLTIHDLLESLKGDFQLRGKASAQNLSHLKKADADFGQYLAVSLTPEKIDDYKKQRLADGDKPASINRPLQVVRQAYRLAMKRETISRMPYIGLLSESGNAREGFFSQPELRAVLEHLPTNLRDYVAFCGAIGMRKNEAACLTWSMLHDDELQIPGDITKNRESRTLPISGQLVEIIDRRKAARRIEDNGTVRMAEFIFHWNGGQQIREFRKSWARACCKAKQGVMRCPKCAREGEELTCPNCEVATKYHGRIFHDLRRSAVRAMVKAGVSTQIAKRWSGHKSDDVFHRYSILTTDDLREAQQRTENYREAEEQKVIAMR